MGVTCDECGCDVVNGYVPGEPCPDCEVCACGHNALAHENTPMAECFECGCEGFRPRTAGA